MLSCCAGKTVARWVASLFRTASFHHAFITSQLFLQQIIDELGGGRGKGASCNARQPKFASRSGRTLLDLDFLVSLLYARSQRQSFWWSSRAPVTELHRSAHTGASVCAERAFPPRWCCASCAMLSRLRASALPILLAFTSFLLVAGQFFYTKPLGLSRHSSQTEKVLTQGHGIRVNTFLPSSCLPKGLLWPTKVLTQDHQFRVSICLPFSCLP